MTQARAIAGALFVALAGGFQDGGLPGAWAGPVADAQAGLDRAYNDFIQQCMRNPAMTEPELDKLAEKTLDPAGFAVSDAMDQQMMKFLEDKKVKVNTFSKPPSAEARIDPEEEKLKGELLDTITLDDDEEGLPGAGPDDGRGRGALPAVDGPKAPKRDFVLDGSNIERELVFPGKSPGKSKGDSGPEAAKPARPEPAKAGPARPASAASPLPGALKSK